MCDSPEGAALQKLVIPHKPVGLEPGVVRLLTVSRQMVVAPISKLVSATIPTLRFPAAEPK